VTAIAEGSKLPIENLISPDAVRRLSWDPPQPADEQTVARALAGYGARPWQIELTAGPIAQALITGDGNAADGSAREDSAAEGSAGEGEAPDAGDN
jgi:ribonuclease D